MESRRQRRQRASGKDERLSTGEDASGAEEVQSAGTSDASGGSGGRASQVAMLGAASEERHFSSRQPPTAIERLVASVSGAVRSRPLIARHEVASSTLLQQLVVANILLSALWAVAWVVLFVWKASVWRPPLQVVIISPTLYVAWLIFEPMRLALGYYGNLNEQIGLLGPFLFSSLIQLLPQLYFVTAQRWLGWITLGVEFAMSIVLLLLYLAEVLVAWPTSKRFILKAEATYELYDASATSAR